MTEPSSGEYREAVSDIMDREAQLRRAGIELDDDRDTPAWQMVLVAVLGAAFVAVLAWDTVVLAGGAEGPPPAEVREAAGITTFAVAMEIEAFREREGRWPEDLAEIGFGESGLGYDVTGRGYTLRDPVTGRVVSGAEGTDPLAVVRALDLPGVAAPPVDSGRDASGGDGS